MNLLFPFALVVMAPAQIYLNFDGAVLERGPEDARVNRTSLGTLAGPFAPYGEGAKRDAVLQAVREDWSRYDAQVTAVRPSTGNYVMCMVGPTDAYSPTTLGIAPQDCDDANTRNNVAFAFHRVDDSHSAAATATTISQEVAHSFGLEHVNDVSDIMHPINAGGDASFRNDCAALSDEPFCPAQHERHCGDPGMQNSHAELLSLLGPVPVDPAESGLTIVAPADEERFDVAESVQIIAETNEGFGTLQMALFVNGQLSGIDDDAPFGWTAPELGEGRYSLRVEAANDEGRIAVSETIEFTVGPKTDNAMGDPALPPTRGFSRSESQACNVTAAPSSAWLVFVLPLIIAARPREES